MFFSLFEFLLILLFSLLTFLFVSISLFSFEELLFSDSSVFIVWFTERSDSVKEQLYGKDTIFGKKGKVDFFLISSSNFWYFEFLKYLNIELLLLLSFSDNFIYDASVSSKFLLFNFVKFLYFDFEFSFLTVFEKFDFEFFIFANFSLLFINS